MKDCMSADIHCEHSVSACTCFCFANPSIIFCLLIYGDYTKRKLKYFSFVEESSCDLLGLGLAASNIPPPKFYIDWSKRGCYFSRSECLGTCELICMHLRVKGKVFVTGEASGDVSKYKTCSRSRFYSLFLTLFSLQSKILR